MSNILIPDPYMDLYKAQKMLDPDAMIVLKAYQRKMVDAVDHIVELAHGQRDFVTTDSDWNVMEELIKFFANEWPDEYRDFVSAIPGIREAKGDGYSKSEEIKHVGSIPPRLMKMMRAIFPAQQWDKKFVNKLVNRFPVFKVGR